MEIGSIIMKKRKELGITQQVLAKKLHVSNQAVSKWENGMTCPEISLLPAIAKVFGMSVDSLLGYQSPILSDYEKRYQEKGYYWGIKPNDLCYEILKLKPPIKPLKVLDVGCGEGKDAVFLARNGYHVSAFDLAETGVEKGRALASQHGVYVDFFTANIEDMQLCEDYDIVLCSGVKVGTDKLVSVRRFRAKAIKTQSTKSVLHERFLLLVRSWGGTNKTI